MEGAGRTYVWQPQPPATHLHVLQLQFPFNCELANCCIYTSDKWRLSVMQQPQEVQDWLRDVCKSVIAAGAHNGVPLADWAPVVTDAFPPGEPDRIKHLRTQDFGDSTAVALPPEVRSHLWSNVACDMLHCLKGAVLRTHQHFMLR